MNGKLNQFNRGSFSHVTWESFRKQHEGLSRAFGVPFDKSEDELIRKEYDRLMKSEVWLNDEYQVIIDRDYTGWGGMMKVLHLSIKRIDKEPIHDWRDLQEIKNMLVGEKYEAIELYPSEDRKVDTANQYHLWVLYSWKGREGEIPRVPIGWGARLTADKSSHGAKQRTPHNK